METLVAVAQHRNHQYYDRSRINGPARFGLFGSPPLGNLRGMNCRTFQSGAGILPTPLKSCTTPVTKQAASFSSPKTPSPSVNCPSNDTTRTHLKRSVKSSAIPIPVPINMKDDFNKLGSLNDEFCYSELWAGPAYSNSPPPSSLPIPKFSLRSKRTVSLDLPTSPSGIDFHPIAKSAPTSPSREPNHPPRNFFRCSESSDSATNTLRRILNLDVPDE